ncbi:hypothetical protein GCM10009689_17470 [Brevibacterium antiquum]|uniref:hypothetical protein n=1 Tax=Brevibacterium antiquum TaxID=234835 RepID=UPI0018DFABE6|nr:hypothetical protein [Brevibacterium antiquum]
MAPKKTKTVRFFQLAMLIGGDLSYPNTFDWTPILDNLRARRGKDRKIKDIWFTADDNVQTFGIHNPIGNDFMSSISEEDGTIEDHLAEEGGEKLAYSTAVIPFPGTRFFATVYGAAHSPKQGRVADLATTIRPLADGAFWKVKPIVDQRKIEQLRAARGVLRFSSTFSTQRDLYDPNETDAGPAMMGDAMADSLGGDLELSLDLNLTPYSRQRLPVLKRFKDSIIKELRYLAGSKSNAEATIISQDGQEEVISLVEKDLAMDFVLDLEDRPPRFSELRKLLEDNRAKLEETRKQTIDD